MIAVPLKCPKDVVANLRSAFALYWSDPNAAANWPSASGALCGERVMRERASSPRVCDLGEGGGARVCP